MGMNEPRPTKDLSPCQSDHKDPHLSMVKTSTQSLVKNLPLTMSSVLSAIRIVASGAGLGEEERVKKACGNRAIITGKVTETIINVTPTAEFRAFLWPKVSLN